MKPVPVERWPDSDSSPPVSHGLDACPPSPDHGKLWRADEGEREKEGGGREREGGGKRGEGRGGERGRDGGRERKGGGKREGGREGGGKREGEREGGGRERECANNTKCVACCG